MHYTNPVILSNKHLGGYQIGFFSSLVVESLVDFQRKVAQIMESICFTLNDFNLIVYPLQLSIMDGIFTMI